ncbi:MAG: RcnB family protein [Pseudomonadota bacterium]
MIKKAIVFAVAAACLTSGAAFAQSYDGSHRNDGDRGTRYERQDTNDRYGRNDSNDRYDRSDRRDYRRHDGYSRNAGYDARSYGDRDYGQQRYRMQRGERLSQYDRGDYYVVSDWRSRSLYAPQRGYQWVQAGNDYALVAIATGIIASVLLNN